MILSQKIAMLIEEMLEEAGGELCSFDGSPLKLRSKVSVLGGAKTALSEFLELSKQTAERFI